MERARGERARIFDDFFDRAKMLIAENLPVVKKVGTFAADFILTAPSMGAQAIRGTTFDGKKMTNEERITYGITALSSGSFYVCSGYAALATATGLPGAHEAIQFAGVSGTMSWLVWIDQKGLDIIRNVRDGATAFKPKLAKLLDAGHKILNRNGVEKTKELVEKVEGSRDEQLVEEEEHVG